MAKIHGHRIVEHSYPYVLALAAAAAMYFYGKDLNLQLNATLVSTTTTITSILMGFIGTSYGILLSATSKRIEWAKGSRPIWRAILGFFNISFIGNFVLCVYSIGLALLTSQSLSEQVQRIFTIVWVLLIVFSIVSFFRAMRVLLGLLRTDA